jgi:hypothetical protein
MAGLGQRLSAVLKAEPEVPMPLDIPVWTACADDPKLFTEPLPPLGAVLDTCELAHGGEWLAARGFDFRRWWTDPRHDPAARPEWSTKVCLARHPRTEPTNNLAAGSARVNADHPIGVSYVSHRLLWTVPLLHSCGIFQGTGINADSGMIVSRWDRHLLPHAAPVFLHQPLGAVCAGTRTVA